MKVLPISFSSDMIKSERAGRKNLTRRTRGLEENKKCSGGLKEYISDNLEVLRMEAKKGK